MGVVVAWRHGAWVGLIGLAACTAFNPAFEDDGGSSGSGVTASDAPGPSSTAEPATGDPAETAAPGSTGATSNVETGEAGTSGEPTSTGETGTEDPPPPEVGPYGMPELVPISDPGSEDDDPTLPADMLELYFASRRPGGAGIDDIWVSRRETTDHPWDMPVPVTELNTEDRENTPEISLDGRVMFFSSTRGGLVEEDVFMSMRADQESEWSPPTPVTAVNTAVRDVGPFVTAGGLHMYACTGPNTTLDLVHFERETLAGAWSAPFPIVELNTVGQDCGAWVDASRLVIAFMSDRPGSVGSTDLWTASRGSVEEPFGPPFSIVGPNSTDGEDDPWLSQDGDVVYFASDRTGFQDLYVAYRM
jgi:hypothetical protein